MKLRIYVVLIILMSIVALQVSAQFVPRKDLVWARDISKEANPTITLDGILNEPMWAKAESVVVAYGFSSGKPTSGWKRMGGYAATASDSARAVVKYLVNKNANKLYLAMMVKDSSVGGNGWEKADGTIIRVFDRNSLVFTKVTQPKDAFISWTDSTKKGQMPRGIGSLVGKYKFGVSVQGTTNCDTLDNGQQEIDGGWIYEIEFDLTLLGYNANSSQIECVEHSFVVWDNDWEWPLIPTKNAATRVWWMYEWGNTDVGLAGRVLMRNDVGLNTTVFPEYPPDVIIRNAATYSAPTIDGALTESVWNNVPYFDIHYGDDTLRASYPSVGKYRSGQYKSGGEPNVAILDPGNCRVKWFFKNDILYASFDIDDQSVQTDAGIEYRDGVLFMIWPASDSLYDPISHQLYPAGLWLRVDSTGGTPHLTVEPAGGGLAGNALMDASQWGFSLKPGTTLDDPNDADTGYRIELAVDLTKLGYSGGATNKVALLGVTYSDGDKFGNFLDNYSTRTWWFHEWPEKSTPAFCLLDNSALVSTENRIPLDVPREFILIGNFPNPFNPTTTIRYSIPEGGLVTISVYDLLGRKVREIKRDYTIAGVYEQKFDASNLSSGVYYYNIVFTSSLKGSKGISNTQRMMLIK